MQAGMEAIYGNPIVVYLIQRVTQEGKKSIAEKIVLGAMDYIKEKAEQDPFVVLELAMKNASPLLEVRPRRVGGATYQVPYEVRGERRRFLAVRWMMQAARAKKGKPMAVKLAEEILAAAHNEGEAVRKKENTHRMAEANRAFAHFAW